eukprot:TRINITY_DN26898_c0_g1_i1.p1 TRINITY_DN26898_c0_g1~~TRINITY_DN26898_c0_g1_i1.p1  ORF type:complete len:132 (+),score=17.28 TRINITY_DN26898_c0_g1_i1:16-411(+)
MRALVITLSCIVSLAAAQSTFIETFRQGLGFQPPLQCEDDSWADCQCDQPPCGPDNLPTCTCKDGSQPTIDPPCPEEEYPLCPGACADNSDALLTPNPLVDPPCADKSFPNLFKCRCADGSIPRPPNPFGR